MSGFGFTEAQEMLRQEVKNFALKEIAPGVKERAKMDWPSLYQDIKKTDQKMAKMGWTSLNAPAKYGGTPIDAVSIGVMTEEISKVDGAIPGPNLTLSFPLLELLPEALQDEWFPAIIRCEKRMALGFTEPQSGSDAGGIKTRAKRDGDYYVINGEKAPLPGAVHADAASISATVNPAMGHRGITMFFVPLNLPGITRRPVPWMGCNSQFPSTATFDDVRVPAAYREGEEGKGFYKVMGTFDSARVLVGMRNIGMALASLEEAMAWAKQRVAFGRPIVKFEGVSFMIAEHWTKVEAARMLCYRALWLKDQKKGHTKESAMAKWYSVETAIQAINASMVVLGWYGYSSEHLIESRLRDALGYQFGDGTRHINQMVIARELMGREALPY